MVSSGENSKSPDFSESSSPGCSCLVPFRSLSFREPGLPIADLPIASDWSPRDWRLCSEDLFLPEGMAEDSEGVAEDAASSGLPG